MSKPALQSKADRDRIRQRSSDAHWKNKKVADTARRIVREHLEHGRSAQACMADLIRAARGES